MLYTIMLYPSVFMCVISNLRNFLIIVVEYNLISSDFIYYIKDM
jgi:hypothetical protein